MDGLIASVFRSPCQFGAIGDSWQAPMAPIGSQPKAEKEGQNAARRFRQRLSESLR